MSPADILSAARRNIVGPYLPARRVWLAGWVGPVMWRVSPNTDALETAIATGFMHGGRAELRFLDGNTTMRPVERVRLDVHRPEVRDHLVRLGCPEWARDVPAWVWAWGMGVEVRAALGEWDAEPPTHGFHHRRPLFHTSVPGGYLLRHEAYEGNVVDGECKGFGVVPPRWSTCGVGSPAPWGECMAAADLAALNAGCILREPGGWLVPLPGGGVGYFKGGES